MATSEVVGRILTYGDLPDWELDGLRHELIGGEHIAEPSPIPRHQIVSMHLSRLVGGWIQENQLGCLLAGPVDVVFAPTDVVVPDLVFVARDRLDIIGEKYIDAAPDLLVEILSPSTRRRDEIVKRRLYEREGVGEYWVVDPVREAVRVYRLGEGGYRRDAELSAEAGDLLTSPLFPGLTIRLAEIFK
jgi:Uma2 family endonuclease